MNRRINKTSYIAKGGLLTALGVIFVYLSTLLPVNKLYLLAMASSIIPLSVITTNIQTSVVVYAATALLSLLVCGIKIPVILYAVFFGIYGIVKYYIEKLNKIYIEILLKLMFFNLILLILTYIYKVLFTVIPAVPLPIYLLVIFAEIVFLIYDYVLTLFISRVNNYFSKYR
ncbi:hypothetical protein [Clostridium sp. DJ247]|uniref:hypothetical protein n=1 Tax=Clostridium sp. DJ247 TaxID=2726188 RepID=UPI0016280038|nr:hypothetical protein [Clostridium sp. DJ247]MBC2581547.1 hypothetical protein [Clostridium sp. DJ247]